MASLGHIAIGLAAARGYGTSPGRRAWIRAALLWSALSFLPDADVIGFSFGVQYGDEWGHRGATHSFAFSLALGAAIGLAAPLFRLPPLRTGVIATLVLTSHALLDTLTNGGLGCALLWPFDLTRYFAPWQPIPVSPIGLAFFSPYGMFVAAWEALMFAPVWWFALTRDRSPRLSPRRIALASAWIVLVWLFTSTDPLRERVVASVLRDGTRYTPGFSEEKLSAVERGQSEGEVRKQLGEPFQTFTGFMGTCWVYSRPPADGTFFRARAVCFVDGRVDGIVRRWVR